jgi:ABC-type nitrate/sulfonate/bicarbonate transport system substrate-binding protein
MTPRSLQAPVLARPVSLVGLLCGLLLAACGPTQAPASKPAPTAAALPAASAAGAAAPAPAAPLSLRVAYAAASAGQAPVWLAQEHGLFRQYGLDTELVFLSSIRTDQGVITGDTPIGFGTNVLAMRLSGADLIAIGGVMNYMPYTVIVGPGITSPQDLRGKTAVVTQPGASNTVATLIMLRRWGLEPDRDVAIQHTPGVIEQLALLTQRLADVALLTPPGSSRAVESGLTALMNTAPDRIPFLLTAIGTTESYAREHPEEVRRFLRAYVAAVGVARKDPAATKALIGKYTQTDDPVALDEAYATYRDQWAQPDFRVLPEAIASSLSVLDTPGADTAKPADFVDNRFIDELHQSGFIRQSGALD